TRASMRLLAERRRWAETRRRQRAARTPEPGPPPVIWVMLGWKRWRDRRREYPPATERWFIVERREAEAKLVRAHTSTLQRMAQRSRARRRDREVARETAHRHVHAAGPPPDRAPGPDEKVTLGTIPPSSRGAQRRGDPGQRDKRFSRGPGSPRRQSAARDDGDDHAAGLREPPAEAAPAPTPAPVPVPVPHTVMAGLVPAIHDFTDVADESESWMTGTSPVMTGETTGTNAVTPARDRDDDAHAHAPSDPPAEAAPAPDAPSTAPEPPSEAPVIAPATPETAPTPAPPRFATIAYPPGSETKIRIGAARSPIPPP